MRYSGEGSKRSWLRRATCALALLVPLQAAALPTPEQVKSSFRSSDATLLDRHGEPLHSLRIDLTIRRTQWVALQDISPALPGAILQAEDQRFYRHGGADFEALGKAAWDNLFRSRPRGASTITMQLAALLDPKLQASRDGRSLGQKWDQIRAAQELEKSWSKPQILEAYLNLTSFRGELQGIDAAARTLFGKAPSGLDQAESALLAALIRGPNAPPKIVTKRACKLARDARLATTCAAIGVAAGALDRPPPQNADSPAAQAAAKLLKRAGQRLPSTLDAGLQRFAFDSVRRRLAALKERNVGDAAVLALDNRSGEILAYVANGGDNSVDGIAAPRQAGSTLKPFLYQLALERKYLTAASILDDSPVDIATPSGLYVPQNYDKDFKGYASVRTSLASSLNVPAVRTLLLTGTERFHERLKQLGFSTLTEAADHYGYALALGAADVTLLDLTNAYRTLANGGLAGPVTFAPGGAAPAQRVLDARAGFVIADILSDRAARSLTFGLKNDLATPYWSAVKTGTSKDMRDNWCIGFSSRFTVGVWVGNFDGQPMWDVSGVTGAAPIWRDVMDFLHRGAAPAAPRAPAGIVGHPIEYRPEIEAARAEWFLAGTESDRIEVPGPARRAARIRYPADGMIVAIDPDIPAANQRLLFQAQGGADLLWQLDGVALGSAAAEFSWHPTAGAHVLALVDGAGKTFGSVRFAVRAAGSAEQPAE